MTLEEAKKSDNKIEIDVLMNLEGGVDDPGMTCLNWIRRLFKYYRPFSSEDYFSDADWKEYYKNNNKLNNEYSWKNRYEYFLRDYMTKLEKKFTYKNLFEYLDESGASSKNTDKLSEEAEKFVHKMDSISDETVDLKYKQKYIKLLQNKENQRTALVLAINLNHDDPYRFLYEILQNADDCEYEEKTKEFSIDLTDARKVVIHYNEKGMNYLDVNSLTDIGNSSKTNQKQKRQIGEKGVGFKTIFKKFQTVKILSGGYPFKLTSTSTRPETLDLEDEDLQKVMDNYREDGTTLILETEGILKDEDTLDENRHEFTRKLFQDIKAKYGLHTEKIVGQQAFCECPVMFTNRLNKITIKGLGEDGTEEEYVIERKDEKNKCLDPFIYGTRTITYYYKNEGDKEWKKLDDISCNYLTKEVQFSYNAYIERYPDSFDSEKDYNNAINNNQFLTYPLTIIAPCIEHLEKYNIEKGMLYSYLPTHTQVLAPFSLDLPLKLAVNRGTMIFYGEQDTAGETKDADTNDTYLWNKEIWGHVLGSSTNDESSDVTTSMVRKFYQMLERIGVEKGRHIAYSYIPQFEDESKCLFGSEEANNASISKLNNFLEEKFKPFDVFKNTPYFMYSKELGDFIDDEQHKKSEVTDSGKGLWFTYDKVAMYDLPCYELKLNDGTTFAEYLYKKDINNKDNNGNNLLEPDGILIKPKKEMHYPNLYKIRNKFGDTDHNYKDNEKWGWKEEGYFKHLWSGEEKELDDINSKIERCQKDLNSIFYRRDDKERIITSVSKNFEFTTKDLKRLKMIPVKNGGEVEYYCCNDPICELSVASEDEDRKNRVRDLIGKNPNFQFLKVFSADVEDTEKEIYKLFYSFIKQEEQKKMNPGERKCKIVLENQDKEKMNPAFSDLIEQWYESDKPYIAESDIEKSGKSAFDCMIDLLEIVYILKNYDGKKNLGAYGLGRVFSKIKEQLKNDEVIENLVKDFVKDIENKKNEVSKKTWLFATVLEEDGINIDKIKNCFEEATKWGLESKVSYLSSCFMNEGEIEGGKYQNIKSSNCSFNGDWDHDKYLFNIITYLITCQEYYDTKNEKNSQKDIKNDVLNELLQNANDIIKPGCSLKVELQTSERKLQLSYEEKEKKGKTGFTARDFFSIASKGWSGKTGAAQDEMSEGKKGSGFKSVYKAFSKAEIDSYGIKCVLDKKVFPKPKYWNLDLILIDGVTDTVDPQEIFGKGRTVNYPVPIFDKSDKHKNETCLLFIADTDEDYDKSNYKCFDPKSKKFNDFLDKLLFLDNIKEIEVTYNEDKYTITKEVDDTQEKESLTIKKGEETIIRKYYRFSVSVLATDIAENSELLWVQNDINNKNARKCTLLIPKVEPKELYDVEGEIQFGSEIRWYCTLPLPIEQWNMNRGIKNEGERSIYLNIPWFELTDDRTKPADIGYKSSYSLGRRKDYWFDNTERGKHNEAVIKAIKSSIFKELFEAYANDHVDEAVYWFPTIFYDEDCFGTNYEERKSLHDISFIPALCSLAEKETLYTINDVYGGDSGAQICFLKEYDLIEKVKDAKDKQEDTFGLECIEEQLKTDKPFVYGNIVHGWEKEYYEFLDENMNFYVEQYDLLEKDDSFYNYVYENCTGLYSQLIQVYDDEEKKFDELSPVEAFIKAVCSYKDKHTLKVYKLLLGKYLLSDKKNYYDDSFLNSIKSESQEAAIDTLKEKCVMNTGSLKEYLVRIKLSDRKDDIDDAILRKLLVNSECNYKYNNIYLKLKYDENGEEIVESVIDDDDSIFKIIADLSKKYTGKSTFNNIYIYLKGENPWLDLLVEHTYRLLEWVGDEVGDDEEKIEIINNIKSNLRFKEKQIYKDEEQVKEFNLDVLNYSDPKYRKYISRDEDFIFKNILFTSDNVYDCMSCLFPVIEDEFLSKEGKEGEIGWGIDGLLATYSVEEFDKLCDKMLDPEYEYLDDNEKNVIRELLKRIFGEDYFDDKEVLEAEDLEETNEDEKDTDEKNEEDDNNEEESANAQTFEDKKKMLNKLKQVIDVCLDSSDEDLDNDQKVLLHNLENLLDLREIQRLMDNI